MPYKLKEKAKQKAAERSKALRDAGLCRNCRQPVTDGKVHCAECRAKISAKNRQQYPDKCPHCPLTRQEYGGKWAYHIGSHKRAAALGKEGLSAAKVKRDATLGLEGRRAARRKALKTLGEEGLRAAAAKTKAKIGVEGYKEIAARRLAKMTAEERSAAVKKGWAKLSPEERSARIQKSMSTMGEEGRSARAKKRAENMTAERRLEIILKGHKTLGEDGLLARGRAGADKRSRDRRGRGPTYQDSDENVEMYVVRNITRRDEMRKLGSGFKAEHRVGEIFKKGYYDFCDAGDKWVIERVWHFPKKGRVAEREAHLILGIGEGTKNGEAGFFNLAEADQAVEEAAKSLAANFVRRI